MTVNLTPQGTDAWIDRLYATGPTNSRVRLIFLALDTSNTV
jgi:hypothetical protein